MVGSDFTVNFMELVMDFSTYGMMVSQYQWSNQETLIEFLARKLAAGNLILVLGAGISHAFGLPKWEALVENLYDQKREVLTREDRRDLNKAVRKFKETYFVEENAQGFLDCIHHALYKKAPPDFHQLFEINQNASDVEIKDQISNLRALAAISAVLSMAKATSQEALAISFNFDNVLEKYLQYNGVSVCSIHGNSWRKNDGQIKIYHTHGFLPFFANDKDLALSRKKRSASVILDEDSFKKVVGNYLDSNNQDFLHATRRNFPIYIGLSANDQNMKNLMQQSHEDHPNISDLNLYCGLFITRHAQDFDSKSTKVFPLEVKEHEEAYRLLMKVCQRCVEIISNKE